MSLKNLKTLRKKILKKNLRKILRKSSASNAWGAISKKR